MEAVAIVGGISVFCIVAFILQVRASAKSALAGVEDIVAKMWAVSEENPNSPNYKRK